ncbi:undecaprenyl/decaprenyl-phosphate alpha-N-acetylglucosaminyl 1-phosphate transferase [Patescibacteria group bacterium AH-259-L07]|nr:undecaprenyl/decaprenyl-phosphate alpha-N-acetylglucosaminyl 1-phosphate transferase [Patescibacteria group bacterium AH-259-L07]
MIYYPLFIAPFIISVVSIYFLRKQGHTYHLYDEPGENKIHQKPVPYLGGVGIFLGFTGGLIIARLLHQISGLQAAGVILGSSIILFIGFWDDLKWKKKGRTFLKLLYQFLVGFLIVFILIKIGVNFQFSINPILMALAAALYILVVMNAINVNDGLDGLSGGIVGISLIGFIMLSFLTNNWSILTISGVLLASILGFLISNWHPASIFMGDNGSHFLGFSLAILAIIFTGHPFYNLKQFIGPLLIVGFPLIDIGWTFIVRLAQQRSPFSKGRDYLYDQLYFKLNFSTPKTVLICYAFQILLVTGGVLIYYI